MSRLRIYSDAVRLVRLCRPHWEAIRRFHPELSKQLRRSAVAVGSNMTEGDGRFDGNGRERLRTAMYEAKETRDHLEIAVAAGAIAEDSIEEAYDLADKIAATLYKIVGQRG